MRRSGHLEEEQLLECYVAGRTGEPLNPRLAEHLDTCAACADQYQDLTIQLEDVRRDGTAEADAVFGPDVLARQQAQIARRLEHIHRSAKVIAFPGRDASPSGPRAGQLTTRWIAAAAAAGLFIGVAVGGYLGPERLRSSSGRTTNPSSAMAVQRPAQPGAVLVNSTQPAAAADEDAFMMELELALARPQPRELAAFDALTPHVRDIR